MKRPAGSRSEVPRLAAVAACLALFLFAAPAAGAGPGESTDPDPGDTTEEGPAQAAPEEAVAPALEPLPPPVDVEALRLAGRRAFGRGVGMFGATIGWGIAAGLPLAWGFIADDLDAAAAGSFLALSVGPIGFGLAIGNWIQAGWIASVVRAPGAHRDAWALSRARRGYWRTASLAFGGAVAAGTTAVLLVPVVRASVAHPPPPVLGAAFAGGFATSFGLSALFVGLGHFEARRMLGRQTGALAWSAAPWLDSRRELAGVVVAGAF